MARNASFLAGATIVSRLLTFGLGVVIARHLGAADYGRYGVAIAVATMLLPLADLGTTPYLSREAARDRALADRLALRLAAVRSATSIGLALAVALGASALVGDDRTALAIVLVLVATLADGTSQFAFGYFQGRERMGFEALTTSAAALLRTVGGVVLAVGTGRLIPVLAWMVGVSLLQLVVTGTRLWRAVERPEERTERAGPDWRTVVAMGLIGVFVMVYLRADTVMIGWLLDETEAGLYTAAYTIMSSLQIVPWMVALALTPVFARSHGRDDALFRRSWHEGLRTVLVVALPLALVAAVLAGPIVERVFGGEYDRSASTLAIIVWSCPVASMNVLMAAVMRGAGREGWLTAASGAGAVLNVGLNVWAIRAFGIAGAAATTITTEVVVLVGLAAVAVHFGVVGAPRLPVVRMAGALGVLAVAAVVSEPLPVEARGVLALAAYGAAALGLRVVGTGDLDRLRSAARRRGPTGVG